MRDFIASQNSERLRQRLTGAMRVREPAAFARLARSLFEIALVTGIIARLYRMMVLRQVTTPTNAAIALGIGALFLLLMATLHLSRFPLRDWLWRAPAFGIAEGASEMLTSLGLIWAGREPIGSSAAAHLHDWPGMAASTIGWRLLIISLFSLLLALVVKWVRFMILRNEHAAWSEGTVRAGIPGEGFIERRGSRTPTHDPLLFGDRRKHDKKRRS
jgi:MFS family permease